MARQNIDIGSSANDGTGDTLRQAAQKINETLVEIYQKFGGDSDILSPVVSIDASGIVVNLGNTFTLTATTPPSSNRIILLPDADGTVTINEAQQTLLQKTLTSPTINNPIIGTGVRDSNANELIDITAAASAVNQFTMTNAATGNAPTIGVAGDDSNVNLNLTSKGSGSVSIDKVAYESIELTTDGTASATATYIVCNKGTALAVGLDSGTTTGEFKIFTNKGAGTATITPASFAQGASFALPQYSGAQVIWDGDDWYLLGRDSDITIS